MPTRNTLSLMLTALLLAPLSSLCAAEGQAPTIVNPQPATAIAANSWRVVFVGGAAPRQTLPQANQAFAQAVIDWMDSPEVLMIARNQAQFEAKTMQVLLNTLPEATQGYRLLNTAVSQPLIIVHDDLDAEVTDLGVRIRHDQQADVLLPWPGQIASNTEASLHWQQLGEAEQGLRLPLRAADGDYTSVQAGKYLASEWVSVNRALLVQAERLQLQAMHLNVGWPKMRPGSATGFAEHDPLLLSFTPRMIEPPASVMAKSGTVDLFIDGQVQPAPQIPIGDEFDIVVRLRNLGTGDASNVTMSANLDGSLRFVSVTPPAGWTCPVQPQAGDPSGLLTCATSSFAAGADQTLVVRQRVPLTVGSGSESYPGFEISSADPDINPNNNVDEPGMLAVSHANLGITAQYTSFPLVQGQSVGIIYQIQNAGPHSGIDLTATLTLPANLGFQGVFPAAGWVCATTPAPDASGQVVCTKTQMAVGTEQITVQARVRDEAVTGTEVVIAGEISSGISEDDSLDNNIVERSTVIREREADVSLGLNTLPMAEAEGTIDLNLSARNQGIDPAQNTLVTLNYPAGTHFQALTASGWTCTTTPMLSCTRNSLPVSGNANLLLTLAIDADRHNSTITGSASISSDWQDPVPANNSLPFQIVVKPDADLSTELLVGPAIMGQPLSYSLQVSNAGPDAIANTVLTFQPANGLRFASMTAPSGWACSTPDPGSFGNVSCVRAASFEGQGSFELQWSIDPMVIPGAVLFSQASVSAPDYRELNELQNGSAAQANVLSEQLLKDSFE